jgi:hypothetical protein
MIMMCNICMKVKVGQVEVRVKRERGGKTRPCHGGSEGLKCTSWLEFQPWSK